jgi:dodecin
MFIHRLPEFVFRLALQQIDFVSAMKRASILLPLSAVFGGIRLIFGTEFSRVIYCSPKNKVMAIVKVIEVIASSEKGIEDAIQNALTEASKTVRNIDSIFVKDIKVHVKDNKISTYGLICKISFRLEDASR